MMNYRYFYIIDESCSHLQYVWAYLCRDLVGQLPPLHYQSKHPQPIQRAKQPAAIDYTLHTAYHHIAHHETRRHCTHVHTNTHIKNMYIPVYIYIHRLTHTCTALYTHVDNTSHTVEYGS